MVAEHYLRQPVKDQLQILTEYQSNLDSTKGQGFLASVDLTTYPIFSAVLPSFINTDN